MKTKDEHQQNKGPNGFLIFVVVACGYVKKSETTKYAIMTRRTGRRSWGSCMSWHLAPKRIARSVTSVPSDPSGP